MASHLLSIFLCKFYLFWVNPSKNMFGLIIATQNDQPDCDLIEKKEDFSPDYTLNKFSSKKLTGLK